MTPANSASHNAEFIIGTVLGERALLSQVRSSISLTHSMSMPPGLQAYPPETKDKRQVPARLRALSPAPPNTLGRPHSTAHPARAAGDEASHRTPTARQSSTAFHEKAIPRVERSGQMTPSSAWKPAPLRDGAHGRNGAAHLLEQ